MLPYTFLTVKASFFVWQGKLEGKEEEEKEVREGRFVCSAWAAE